MDLRHGHEKVLNLIKIGQHLQVVVVPQHPMALNTLVLKPDIVVNEAHHIIAGILALGQVPETPDTLIP